MEPAEEGTTISSPVDLDGTCTVLDSPSPQQSENVSEQQTMKVYLRIRPFSKDELLDNEDQDCVVIESDQMVALRAPKGSATMKSSEKGVGLSMHKFSFSQIFGPETSQAELFEDTVQSQMCDFLEGKNSLLFSYGVTNAGKTFTIQGTSKEPGVLPRVLDATFEYIGVRQYVGMDLKPHRRSDAQSLDAEEVKQERSAKAAVFASYKDESEPHRASGGSESDSAHSISNHPTELGSAQAEGDGSRFALWVAFFEIYNECVYDLLQSSLMLRSKKRAALRVCDDGVGNVYVKDLRWINVHNLAEACRLMQIGNKNRSAAATKMNQSSSRSHSIFTMKLLRIDGGDVRRISEFSLCDLAGSERCHKTKTFGERLKEAGNINNSLLILGKCITALRNNQTDGRAKSSYIPFRESKLTKLFQTFFCGRGRASMIVNINQCASTYDETLHVMKFSAVAKQVVQVEKPLEAPPPFLVRSSQALEGFLPEDELLSKEDEEEEDEEDKDEDEDEDEDMSLLPQKDLVTMIESLRTKLLAERRRNLVQETEIRKEMGDAMLQQLMESEELRSRQMEELKDSYQEKMENTFQMYKDAIKEHAYSCAISNLEDDYVPLDRFLAEQQEVEVLRRKLQTLGAAADSGVEDKACQTAPAATEAGEDRLIRLYKEKRALETMCEDKQKLILSQEKQLMTLREMLQRVRESFLEKCGDVEALQVKVDVQTKSMEELLCQKVSKEQEMAALKAEVSRLSEMSHLQPKAKRGLLANLKEAVTSPRKKAAGRSLRKTVQTPQH